MNCKECPWYDDGDFELNGEPYCRGIIEYGQCPFFTRQYSDDALE